MNNYLLHFFNALIFVNGCAVENQIAEQCSANLNSVFERKVNHHHHGDRSLAGDACCPGLVCNDFWKCVKEEHLQCAGSYYAANECGSTAEDAQKNCCAGFICAGDTGLCMEKDGSNIEKFFESVADKVNGVFSKIFGPKTENQSVSDSLFFEDIVLATVPKSLPGSLQNILKISPDGKSIANVARSYDGGDWQVASMSFSFISITCDDVECTFRIPPSSDDTPPFSKWDDFSVVTSDYALSRTNELARFLEQSTFGTTKEDLDSFDEATPADVAIADWIKDQIENKEMSLHREYFRKRVVHHFPIPQPIARPLDPCEKNTRYRRYAFSSKDRKRQLKIKPFGSKFMLSIDDEIRTLVSSIDWCDSDYNNYKWTYELESAGSMPTNDTSFTVCYEPQEFIDGTLIVRDFRTNTCYEVCVNERQAGNPPIELDGMTSLPTHLRLSDSDATSINDIFFNNYNPQNLILIKSLEGLACEKLGSMDGSVHYHALYNNIWYIHTPPPLLLDNTVNSPIMNGGGESKKLTNGATMCATAPRTFLNEDGCRLSYNANACTGTPPKVVCGSPGEISNDLYSEGPENDATFDVATRFNRTTNETHLISYRKSIWLNTVLSADDQLRQRMAWALNEIMVIAAPFIETRLNNEMYVAYYDIMVRHAFGNFRDILREISFSSIMGEGVSFINSKSTAYFFRESNIIVQPDENYAREIMQLFTMGTCKLNLDGTKKATSIQSCIKTYTNADLMEYSRAWTGFVLNKYRGNIESQDDKNRVDPMDIQTDARDPFPKHGVNGIYIGDKYPLCIDRPEYHFLKKGAKYRLLGGSSNPEVQHDPFSWQKNPNAVRMNLSPKSFLYKELCNYQDASGKCDFPSIVLLDTNFPCTEKECDVDTVRVVEVTSGIFYEYISEPCVHQAFYNDAVKVVKRHPGQVFCANKRSEVASTACCESDSTLTSMPAERDEIYWGERMRYNKAADRCLSKGLFMCNNPGVSDCGDDCASDVSYWTNKSCTLRIKIEPVDGKVAIVHDAEDDSIMALHVDVDTTHTYFTVQWKNDEYPTAANNCGGNSLCTLTEGQCVCPVSVEEKPKFNSAATVTAEDILSMLVVGAHDPTSLGYTYNNAYDGFTVHQVSEGGLSIDTIFEVRDEKGVTFFLKNVASTVNVVGSSTPPFSFRNPPHFLSLPDIEKRDALHETDATIDQYFYDDNTAPFIATMLTQKFGISNPSPNYVLATSRAFISGEYTYLSPNNDKRLTFGSGKYGDLGAVVAAILLNPEARNVLLDTDPSHGNLREPLLKAVAVMRSFNAKGFAQEPLFIPHFQAFFDAFKQEAYEAQSIFAYFFPEFQSSGPVVDASLYSPEAQLLTGPNAIAHMNGLFSLIKYGVTSYYGGFFLDRCGQENIVPGDYQCSNGYLGDFSTGTSATDIIDELSTLMTSGRLSAESKRVVENIYSSSSNKVWAKMMAQQIIATSPEFQTTGTVEMSTKSRPTPPIPIKSVEPYKAVVYVFLGGGVDTFNVIVPTCEPYKTKYLQKRKIAALFESELLSISTPPDTNQVCNDFAIHYKLSNLQTRYNNGQALFFANAGVLSDEGIDRTNYKEKEKSILFAHDRMTESTFNIDPYLEAPGLGILGRLTDALSEINGKISGEKYKIGSYSINGVANVLTGTVGKSPPVTILDKSGPTLFDPHPWSSSTNSTVDLQSAIDEVNRIPTLESSVFGKTWSSSFTNAVQEMELLDETMKTASVKETFVETALSQQLEQVAKLIDIKDKRGVDRDIFYASMPEWDHHTNVKQKQEQMFPILDEAIESFWKEMYAQNKQDDVVLVVVSEFGRSLSPNSNTGTDHGWGGNYWIQGGDVRGSRILGEYPNTFDGLLDTDRGRLVPTTSWDSIWNGIVQWMGVEDDMLLNQILPSRHHFEDQLFTKEDLFKSSYSQRARNLRADKK